MIRTSVLKSTLKQGESKYISKAIERIEGNMADDEAELRQTHAQNMSDLDALTKKLQQSLQGHNDFASSQPIEASGFA